MQNAGRIKLLKSRPLTTAIAYDLGRILAFSTEQDAIMTKIDIQEGAEVVEPGVISFDPPYKLEASKTYGMRCIGGRQQIWEISGVSGPSDECEWVKEAERHRRPGAH